MKAQTVFAAAAAARALLICFGEWQDAHLTVRYTDVDYAVFTDAARFVSKGLSPYERYTYRYSPLLAYALIPNVTLHAAWGKALFALSDLLVGWLSLVLLRRRGCPEDTAVNVVAVWLFNPFTAPIGTRGNCEAVVGALILFVVHSLITSRIVLAALAYGLAVHLRLYPIIYAPALLLFLNKHHPMCRRDAFNRCQLVFACVAAILFLGLGALFYALYGPPFVEHSYLYHATRSDPRHNFSIMWYRTYLTHDQAPATIHALLGFLPQVGILLVLAWVYAGDLPFCMFVQTFAFVAFNKVSTAQYFVWYFALLPVTMPALSDTTYMLVSVFAVWGLTQVHWLAWAYHLEFKGLQVFLPLWAASCAFLAANVWVLVTVMRRYRFAPVFCDGRVQPYSCSSRILAKRRQ